MNYQEIYSEDYFNGKNSFFYMFGYGNMPHAARAFNQLYEQIEKYLPKKKNVRVLDVGCAYGFMLERFPKNFKKYGIDVSKHAIEVAQKRNSKIHYTVGEIENALPYEAQFFDVVIMNDVIEHIKNPQKVLKHIRTVLKKGGVLYVTTPNLNIIRKIFFAYADMKEHHISLFTHQNLLKLLKCEKYTVLENWTFWNFHFYLRFQSNFGSESGFICTLP